MLFGSDSYEPNNIPDPPGCPRVPVPKYNSKNFDINLAVTLFYSIFTEQLKQKDMDIWNEFVLKYFPDYYSSDLIAEANDLDLLLHDNFDPDSSAGKLLKTKYNNNNWSNELENDYREVMLEIYKQSIESYLKSIKL